MGFLDRKSRVVDFVLTERGRKLYSVGQLDFAYYSFFDDGIDYDPYATGTLSDADREVQIEAMPLLEAPFVRDVRAAIAPLEPTHHLFTAAAGYTLVPFMDSPTDASELSASCDQRVRGGVYGREATSFAQIDLSLEGESEPGNPGFSIRVFSSGSNGLTELIPRRDLAGRRAYDPFLAVKVDDEQTVDAPTVTLPSSVRGR